MAIPLIPCCDPKILSNQDQTGRAGTLYQSAIEDLHYPEYEEDPYYPEKLVEYLELHNVDERLLSDVKFLFAEIEEEHDGYVAGITVEDIEKFIIDRYRSSYFSTDQLLSYMKVGLVTALSFSRGSSDPLKELINILTYGGYDINTLIAKLIIDEKSRANTLTQSLDTIMENGDSYIIFGLLTYEIGGLGLIRYRGYGPRRFDYDTLLEYNLIRIPNYAKFLKWLGYRPRSIIDIAYESHCYSYDKTLKLDFLQQNDFDHLPQELKFDISFYKKLFIEDYIPEPSFMPEGKFPEEVQNQIDNVNELRHDREVNDYEGVYIKDPHYDWRSFYDRRLAMGLIEPGEERPRPRNSFVYEDYPEAEAEDLE